MQKGNKNTGSKNKNRMLKRCIKILTRKKFFKKG